MYVFTANGGQYKFEYVSICSSCFLSVTSILKLVKTQHCSTWINNYHFNVDLSHTNMFCGHLQGLEQGKHELRLKLEGCQSQWESQVSELERDVGELRAEVERLTRALAESERDRSRERQEHGEHSQRLGELLSKVSPPLPPMFTILKGKHEGMFQ